MYGRIALPPLSPFEWIVLENASYLVDDDTRWAVFEKLRERIGVTPDAILKHDATTIAKVVADGGMKPLMRAEKVLDCARIAREIGLERLGEKRMLRRFPGIGEPSADKILLFTADVPSLAPDSNALRVVTRLGIVDEQTSYARTYQLAIRATQPELRDAADARAAHLLLRRHGQEVCKRSAPRCEVCPLRDRCAWYRSAAQAVT
jgi:endonuclease III